MFGYTSTSVENTFLLCYLLAKGRPDYIPQECTIRQALTSCLEIRAVPRKVRYSIPGGISSGEEEEQYLENLWCLANVEEKCSIPTTVLG